MSQNQSTSTGNLDTPWWNRPVSQQGENQTGTGNSGGTTTPPTPTLDNKTPKVTEGQNNPTGPTTPSPTDEGSNYPTTAQTLGQPMYPWLMPWQGPFAAPVTPYESQGLNNLSSLAGNNFGLNSSQDYINNLLNGQYLNVQQNPYLSAIGSAADAQRQIQDSRALQELQSRAAAGGNGLSGALIQQEGDYQRGSNAAFNQMMNQMYQNAYQQERGYQNSAPQMQENLLNSQMQGNSLLTGLGSIPRDVANQELQGEYNDFLRQGNALQSQYNLPEYLALGTLGHGYPGQTQNSFGPSDAMQLGDIFSQLFGSGGAASGIDWGSLLNGLFGGGGDTTAPASSDGSLSADGIKFDGTTQSSGNATQSNQSAYQQWLNQIGAGGVGQTPNYQSLLTGEQAANAQKQAQLGQPSSASKVLTVLSLLAGVMKNLGSNSKQPSRSSSPLGVGTGPGGGSKPSSSGNQDQSGDITPNPNDYPGGPNDPFGAWPGGSTDTGSDTGNSDTWGLGDWGNWDNGGSFDNQFDTGGGGDWGGGGDAGGGGDYSME